MNYLSFASSWAHSRFICGVHVANL